MPETIPHLVALGAFVVIAGAAAVGLINGLKNRSALVEALKSAAGPLDFVFNEQRELGSDVNTDEFWCERIVGVRDDRSVVAGRFEVEHYREGSQNGGKSTTNFAEIHVELDDDWDCGTDVVSKTDDGTRDYYDELLDPLETGDTEFDRDFDVRVQLPESIEPILLSEDVQSVLRGLADECHRVRIADGTLQMRHKLPVEELNEPDGWIRAVDEIVEAARQLDDAVRD